MIYIYIHIRFLQGEICALCSNGRLVTIFFLSTNSNNCWQNSSRREVNSHCERDCDASGFHFLSHDYTMAILWVKCQGPGKQNRLSWPMNLQNANPRLRSSSYELWSASFLLQSPILMAKISRKHPDAPCTTYRLSTGSFVESCLADFQEADWEGPGTEETLVLYVFFKWVCLKMLGIFPMK